MCVGGGGGVGLGVLRISSDGDYRGVFRVPGFFGVGKFGRYFFG